LEEIVAAVGIRHADHVAPSIRKKLALTSLTSGGRSVGIVRLRTEAMVFFILFIFLLNDLRLLPEDRSRIVDITILC
jgi:hypothetical protein